MAKAKTYAGIDISSTDFKLAFHGASEVLTFENTLDGRKELVRHIKKHSGGRVRVVLESTGIYGLDLAMSLAAVKRFEVIYINPRAAKAYATLGMLRAKTDRVDARLLATMAEDERGIVWQPPTQHALEFRAGMRRIRALVNEKTREKNRLKAAQHTQTTAKLVLEDLKSHIKALDTRIANLQKKVLAHARTDCVMAENMDLLKTIQGVGDRTAAEIVSEISCLPSDLTARQLVASAGLDPRVHQSGNFDARRRISKMGSKQLRLSLYFAALNSVRREKEVGLYHKAMVSRNKSPQLAYVAVARKLLHSMHAMLATREKFEPARFHQPRRKNSAISV